MAEVVITIPNSNWAVNSFAANWNPPGQAQYIDMGTSLSVDGMTSQRLGLFRLPRSLTEINIQIAESTENRNVAGPDFSDQMETAGTIECTASDGSTLTITGIGDTSEPYLWTPSNLADVRAFANTLAGLSDRSLTVVFNDNSNQPPVISNLAAMPMTVAAGGDVMLSATVTDPDMDALTYAWSANPALGSFADASALNTTWTAHEPLIDQTIMLTLTADDGTDSSTAAVSVTVEGIPRDFIPGAYNLVIDLNNDNSFGFDAFPDVINLKASAGVFGVRRQGISAGAGSLTAQIWNNEDIYRVADLKRKPIRLQYNGLYLWGGIIDDAKERKLANGLRVINIKGLGTLAEIGANVVSDISITGDTPVSMAVEEATGLSVLLSTEVVTDFNADAGDRTHTVLRQIQNSSGTRLFEEQDGNLSIASEGIDSVWTLGLSVDDTLNYQVDDPTKTIINAVTIDGTKYIDSDSVDEFGEVLHQGDFPFVDSTQAASIATNILSLYAQPRGLIKATYLMEYIAGEDVSAQNAILQDLHYGNERIIPFDDEGTARYVEILNVSHNFGLDGLHRITLVLRERETNVLALNLCTYHNREVGYFATLPELSADGLRTITGHKIQFRETGTTAWTDAVSAETGLVVNDTFTVPTDGKEYDVRLVATSGTGEEQVSPTQTLRAVNGEARYRLFTWNVVSDGLNQSLYDWYQYRLVDDRLLSTTTELRIIGYDFEGRNFSLPQGLPAWLYPTTRGFGAPQWSDYRNNVTLLTSRQELPMRLPGGLITGNPAPNRDFFNQIVRVKAGSVRTGAQLRFRPIFHSAGATLTTGERGLWSPWLDSIDDITVMY